MKTEELLKLGVPAESINDIMKIHGKDMALLKKKVYKETANMECEKIREAVANMLPMIKEPGNLREILIETNYYYHVENRKPRKNKAEGDEPMAYYKKCEACGANLDPNEKCDCMESITMTAAEETANETEVVTDSVTTENKEETAQ